MREHYTSDQHNDGVRRVPYMSCAMVCGVPNIWPMPTIKATSGSASSTFQSNSMSLDIITKFDEARDTLQHAYNIFQLDLRSLEANKQQHANVGTGGDVTVRSEYEDITSKRNSRDCDINHIDIKIEISTFKEVYLNLDMDESYELKIAGEQSKILYFCTLTANFQHSLMQ